MQITVVSWTSTEVFTRNRIMPPMTLTPESAYLVMFEFLCVYYSRSRSDGLGMLLGDLQLLPDGKLADPAMKADWDDAVRTVLNAMTAGGYEAAAMKLSNRPPGDSDSP